MASITAATAPDSSSDGLSTDSTAPVTWLANDFAAAKSHGAQHFFVFGHKPAYTYLYNSTATAGGLDANPAGTANRDAFWSLIEANGATYFCGHEHTYNMAQPVIRESNGAVRYYAFANVRVFQSGKGRSMPMASATPMARPSCCKASPWPAESPSG